MQSQRNSLVKSVGLDLTWQSVHVGTWQVEQPLVRFMWSLLKGQQELYNHVSHSIQ